MLRTEGDRRGMGALHSCAFRLMDAGGCSGTFFADVEEEDAVTVDDSESEPLVSWRVVSWSMV